MPLVAFAVASAALVAALVSGRPDEPYDGERRSVELRLNDPAPWEVVENAVPLRLAGKGSYWLAFRAFSVGSPARVRISGPAGRVLTVGVSTAPRSYVAGPVQLDGAGSYRLEPLPASTTRRRPARMALFLSSWRLARGPVAALPLRGFWQTESLRDGSTYANWLNTRAQIELVSADPARRQAWLAFDATSVDHERTLTVSGRGGGGRRISVPERGSRRRVVLGPFALRDGRARLEFFSPNPVRYGNDPRPRTVYVSDLAAFGARPGS